ncbi:hypothetical protein [Kribbella sandramycini]|uniref:AsnC-like helix-turn-helix protein n=1 Tax=Kribbella sandramycini TaxID=60450 RepID=A0A841SII4_9ACTN|nr:hypothetical protein [Kribbella sandramycini]
MAAATGASSLFAAIGSDSPAALYRYLTTDIAGLSAVTVVNLTPVLRTVKAATTQYSARRSPIPAR